MPTTYGYVPVRDYTDPDAPTIVKPATVGDDTDGRSFVCEFDQHTLDLIAAG